MTRRPLRDESHEAWKVAKDHTHGWNIPMSVADAALAHEKATNDGPETIIVLAQATDTHIRDEYTWTVDHVGDHGALMHDDRVAVAMGVGCVQQVVNAVIGETGYVVRDVCDADYYTVDTDDGGDSE